VQSVYAKKINGCHKCDFYLHMKTGRHANRKATLAASSSP
jgi:hypothetical protein